MARARSSLGAGQSPLPRFSIAMTEVEAQAVSRWLLDNHAQEAVVAVRDLLWLRAILIEAMKRTDRVERTAFCQRADSVLADMQSALDRI